MTPKQSSEYKISEATTVQDQHIKYPKHTAPGMQMFE